MPSLHNLWKLKASFRSTPSGYKGELASSGGRLKPVFEKKTTLSSCINAKPSSSGGASSVPSSPGSQAAPSRHPFVSSFFSKFFSTSRIPAADHRQPSTADPIHHQSLSATEALTRVFATPSIHGPLLQSCGYTTALECPGDVNGGGGSSSSLQAEKGLSLLAAQLPGRSLQKEKRNVSKQVIASFSSAMPDNLRERTWYDRDFCPEPNGAAEEGGLKYEVKKASRTDIRMMVTSSIKDVFEGKENLDPADRGVGAGKRGNFNQDWRVLEKFAVQGALGIQQVLNRSFAYHFLQPGSSLPAVGDSFRRALHDVSLAGAESPRSVADENHEAEYSEEQSRNSDQEGVNNRSLRLLSGVCCLPHPNKVKTGGEDAYFICSDEQVVGVADGVGGWADVGVNAGEYARELMSQSMIAVAQEPHGYIDPARVMRYAHARTKCRGSSTACILALSEYGLQAANLGDSGFVLMRNGRTIFKSPVQQHQFNIPFQLESGGSDPPSAAEVFSLQVAAGDVIVAGTDGLFDNLYDNELMGVVIHSTRAGLAPQVTAQNIVALARERAGDRNRQTPFSTAAQEAGFRFYGGKMDDITVIVSYITNAKSGLANPSSRSL